MTTAAIYARISKDDGGRLGVARQEKVCRELAARHDLDVTELLVDNDLSAYGRKRRPGFERLVDLMRDGMVDAVITYHADRLYRRTTDLERLVDVVEASGAQVFTVAAGNVDLSTASGRMVARMLGAAAQHESERMGERLRAKSDELASRGRPPGGRPPYGYSRGYQIDPGEAAAVAHMAERVMAGASLISVSREMTASGVATREGRPWHHSTVRHVLVNPAVAGLRVHRREIAGPGDWEPVLDRATWEKVHAVLADPARKQTRTRSGYVLSPLVVNEHGEHMTGRMDRGRDGARTRRTYATHEPCRLHLSIGADELEDVVVGAVLKLMDGAAMPVPRADDTDGTVDGIEAELSELASLRGDGTISLAEWMAARTPLLERLEAARSAVGSFRPVERLLSRPDAVRASWPDRTLAERRQIIADVVDKVIISRATRGRYTPIEDRITVEWKDPG